MATRKSSRRQRKSFVLSRNVKPFAPKANVLPSVEKLESRVLLAPTVWVDDDWAGQPIGWDPPGPATSFGTDAFATIQDGVDSVDNGGTVNVAAGFYQENVLILNHEPGDPDPANPLYYNPLTKSDDRSVKLVGAGRGSTTHGAGNPATDTIIDGNFVDSMGVGFAVAAITGDIGNLEISGFRIQNQYTGVVMMGRWDETPVAVDPFGDSNFDTLIKSGFFNDNLIEDCDSTFVLPSDPEFPLGLMYGGATNQIRLENFEQDNNWIQYNERGMTMGTLDNTIISNNTFVENQYFGITVAVGASNVEVAGNVFPSTSAVHDRAIQFIGVKGTFADTGTFVDYFTDLQVHDNVIWNTDNEAILLASDSSGSSFVGHTRVYNNEIHVTSQDDSVGAGSAEGGIVIRGQFSGGLVEVTGNTVTGSATAGIALVGGAMQAAVQVRDNVLTANAIGVNVDTAFMPGPGLIGVHVNENSISGNTAGLVNTQTILLDGSRNWWGSWSGPTHSGNPMGSGDTVSNYVDYSPWWGWDYASQPTQVWVNGSWSGLMPGMDPDGPGGATAFGYDAFALIQDGVNAIADGAGNTVHIARGLYQENVSVHDKALTLSGVGAGNPDLPRNTATQTVLDGSWGGEGYGVAVVPLTGDIAGFEMSGMRIENYRAGLLLFGRYEGDPAGMDPFGVATSDMSVSSAVVEDNVFVGNTDTRPGNDDYPWDLFSGAVGGVNVPGAVFDGNYARDGRYGMILADAPGTQVTGNTFAGNSKAGVMLVGGGTNNVISGNIVKHDTYMTLEPGIVVYAVSNLASPSLPVPSTAEKTFTDLVISGNAISDTVFEGIGLMNMGTEPGFLGVTQVTGNSISHVLDTSYRDGYGAIALGGVMGGTVEVDGNAITDIQGIGIGLWYGAVATLTNNSISGGVWTGVQVTSGSGAIVGLGNEISGASVAGVL
ncbi:MAG TPA: right-handed parallel beta-helix repeat-containing protein, partial [Candidatus Brocadiia bacterium]|nr:right-handed parallel beta-helix repeat-containing protein [Candidatus Brocadiia bacterium]